MTSDNFSFFDKALGFTIVGLGLAVFFLAVAAIITAPIFMIWNWCLVGSVSFLTTVSFKQAFGIAILILILKYHNSK